MGYERKKLLVAFEVGIDAAHFGVKLCAETGQAIDLFVTRSLQNFPTVNDAPQKIK
jgi:hypothetical protein